MPDTEKRHWLAPGMVVKSAENPDWGLGQVQSVVGQRITVTFEHKGKLVFLGEAPGLVLVI